MSHELDETYGLMNSMVYVGDLPWHRFGTQIPEGCSVEEAIKACPAVDFETIMVNLWHSGNMPSWSDDTWRAKGFKAIVRSDTMECLGVASDRYRPIQIRDQWKGLDPLIDSGLASIESMGSIAGGKKIWGLVKFNKEQIPFWDEFQEKVGAINTYGLVVDDKTGKEKAKILNTEVRVVCQNTLRSAVGNRNCIGIKHVGDTATKAKEAAQEMWGNIVKNFEEMAEKYNVLNDRILTLEEYDAAVLNTVAIIPTNPAEFSTENRFEGARKRAESKRNAVEDLWLYGKGHTGNHSAWEALNGAIEAIDHNDSGVFRTPKTERAAYSMLMGPQAKLKAQITHNLLELAA